MKRLTVTIGGPAGAGIKSSGFVLNKAISRAGYFTFGYSEYPSLIKGGHNNYQVVVADERYEGAREKTDVLVALNKDTVERYRDKMQENGVLIYDKGQVEEEVEFEEVEIIGMELRKMGKEAGGSLLMANSVGLGAVFSILELKIEYLKESIREAFEDKGEKVVKGNILAAERGYEEVEKKGVRKALFPSPKAGEMIVSGNEAIALGALAGGLDFYSAYPMTPSTSILHYLNKVGKEMGVVVKQAWDEISAVNMSLGASFAGARVMTGTSGGGLDLMVEGITMAGVAELPLVVVNAMRPGPALGMPTWTGQGDLLFCVNLGHDEFPRLILAPGDAGEAFDLARKVMDLAGKYQLPVIFISDKYLSESDYSVSGFRSEFEIERHIGEGKEGYKRYMPTESGISDRTIPGEEKGLYVANSYEHDRYGFATEKGGEREEQIEKRRRKMESLRKEIPEQFRKDGEGKIGVISWGSTKSTALSALEELDYGYMNLSWLWPFPKKQVEEFFEDYEKVVLVEGNSEGQLGKLIKQETGLKVDKKILKYDGRPFYVEELRKKLKG